MTVGLAVCALVIGPVLAMIFAVLESVKWRPCGMVGDRHRDDFTRPTGNPGGAVYLLWFLTAAADAV